MGLNLVLLVFLFPSASKESNACNNLQKNKDPGYENNHKIIMKRNVLGSEKLNQ